MKKPKLTWMPESTTGEYVEEELDVKEMAEDQHELSKDTKVEIETNKDPNQQKEAGDPENSASNNHTLAQLYLQSSRERSKTPRISSLGLAHLHISFSQGSPSWRLRSHGLK